MTLYKWSQTASADATADSTIDWSEGQAPSSVNDSARAMMAATAKYRDDIAGAIVTSGTSAAFAVASYSAFDTLAHLNNQIIAFTPNVTNTQGSPSVTLNVDSLGAFPLRTAPGVDIPAGFLIQGTPYVAIFNNTNSEFYLRGFYGNPYGIPLSGMLPYLGATSPNPSFVLPFGQAISRTTYATLFSLIGTTYGVGDGVSTFNVIDLRGRIPAALDTMGGTASGRLTTSKFNIDGTTIGAAGGGPYTQALSDLPDFAPAFTGQAGTVTVSSIGIGQSINGSVSTNAGGTAIIGVQSSGSPSSASGSFTPAGALESINGNQGQTAMKAYPPAIVVPYILRVI